MRLLKPSIGLLCRKTAYWVSFMKMLLTTLSPAYCLLDKVSLEDQRKLCLDSSVVTLRSCNVSAGLPNTPDGRCC